jgi:hypothetical protein
MQYQHVGEVLGGNLAGVFVFPPGAQMPLHDHPGIVMLSRVLYGKLGVMSYDLIVPQPQDNGSSNGDHDSNNWMDVDCNNAHGD